MTEKDAICRDGKRYRTFSHYLREKNGRRIIKVPLTSGCTCPNRDGTKGFGGCAFCTEKGGGEFVSDLPSLWEQYENGRAKLCEKWPDSDTVAYFQSFSNTYCDGQYLEKLLERTLLLPEISGIRIATRCDCLKDDIVDMLSLFSKKTNLTVELGLQTANDNTAQRMNRGHTTAEFLLGYEKLRTAGIGVCVHIINGLPGETKEDMLETARLIGKTAPMGLKIHMLHVLRGSSLADEYEKAPFYLLSLDEYTDIVCSQLEIISPGTVIERLTGDGDKNTLIAPEWTKNKRRVLNTIDKKLAARDSWQAKYWEG